MKLYHGTNIIFDAIDLNHCNPNKDFGQGFYLTSILSQAQSMASRRVLITGKGKPEVMTFDFDETFLKNDYLNVKTFDSPSKEWAEFILQNRYSENDKTHTFDIVIGPVANDGVAFQLERYVQKMITLEQLIQELSYRKLNDQYYFGTHKAIDLLKRLS